MVLTEIDRSPNNTQPNKHIFNKQNFLKSFVHFEWHGTNAADKTTITCSYDQCGKKISCKQFNQQNFDTHIKFWHTSKKKHGSADIRLLLTMIRQSEQEQREENLEDSLVRFDINSIRPRHPRPVYTLEVWRKGLSEM